MVERTEAPDPRWASVDRLIERVVLGDDPALAQVLAVNAAGGLPDIDVASAQGRLLELLARMQGARRVLEVGTLGGYSTICLARAVGAHGQVISLEIDRHHVEVARANLAASGYAARVDVLAGPALASLAGLNGPFDLVFIDADKQNNAAYVREAMRLGRPGTAIIVDNVVREGAILDAGNADPRVQGTIALFELVSNEPRLRATAIQTVGVKKWDGFLLALLDV